MLKFDNGGRLVQALSELPDLGPLQVLYLDVETTSGDSKKDSTNSWKNCGLAGLCVTGDDHEGAWYVPVGHRDSRWNLPRNNVLRWVEALVQTSVIWANHNVKYDAHVLANEGVLFSCELRDTLTGAKIIDSDRFTYGLKILDKDWGLGGDSASEADVVNLWLRQAKTKDFGEVPADILGKYGCQDVITNRKLDRFIENRLPEQCRKVWETEQKLTSVLFDVERIGLGVDVLELKKIELVTMTRMLDIEETLHTETGMLTRPHANDDCYDLLCNHYGLPVLSYTVKDRVPTTNPSFDKEALLSYLRHPQVLSDPKLSRLITMMLEYRKLNTLNSLFVTKFQELEVDGKIHSFYNQCGTRTGRMSCKDPNAQQNSKASKALIHPRQGYSFVSGDYSQIEFRGIIHYINNPRCVKAYQDNPDTDFHQWVAEICEIPRDPAKNVNFAIGYGAGRARIVKMLSSNMILVSDLMAKADGDPDVFASLCNRRALKVFEAYHAMLPELKQTAFRAEMKCKARGYVFNIYGRRRHLPERLAFRAFNAVCQSFAADLQKERTVAMSPRYNPWLRDRDIQICALVHDETLWQMPTETANDLEVIPYLVRGMESPTVSLKVPVRMAVGKSDVNWAEAGSNSIDLDPITRELLA